MPAAGGRKRVAVIGGGPAGLVTMKELKDKGLEVVGFERRTQPGGVYRGTYAGLQLTSSSLLTSFSSFMRERDLDRPTVWQCGEYLEYLADYARHFDLDRHYHYGTEVRSVGRVAGGGWRVRYAAPGAAADAEREIHVDNVVVCSGGNEQPRFPAWADPKSFDGTICHSADIHDERDFAGKRVVVVGLGESGSDIALMAARGGVACAISTRKGPGYVIPRYYRGLPTDLDTNRCYHALPRSMVHTPIVRFKVKIEDALLKPDEDRAVLDKVGELNRARGLPPFHRFATKSTAFVEAMVYHGASYHGDVAELRRDRVVFADGTEFECDMIVCCTGFAPELAFLRDHEPELSRRSRNSRQMYKRMIIPEVGADIAWVGYVRPFVGSVPPCAEMQARYLALLISGEKPMPSPAEMREDIRLHSELDTRQFVEDAERLPTLTDFFRFMESMAHDIGCRPPFRRLLVREPWTAAMVMAGPLTGIQYRLSGPGAEPKTASRALRRMPTMPWAVVAYEAVLLFGCWAVGLTREPWRKWHARRAALPGLEHAAAERPRPVLEP